MSRTEITHNAFYGNNEPLMSYLYELDGQTEIANGMTLARATEIVSSLSDEEMAELEAVGLI